MNNSGWAARSVLVLGAKGMLAHDLLPALRRRLGPSAVEQLAAWDSQKLDIRDPQATTRTLDALRPSVVINTAAFTDVDACETSVDLAMAVNAEGPGNIANACRATDALMVHFGTDYVFDGQSKRPYRPDDAPAPLSIYGRSKWDGEEAVRASGCRHLILRTSWLFGPGRRNFVEKIVERATGRAPLRVVADQIGRPTLAADISQAVIHLLDAAAEGVFHFANEGWCSWFEFAQSILVHAGIQTRIDPITATELARPARRPAYSVLDLGDYVRVTGRTPPPWHDALRRYFEGKRSAVEGSSCTPTAA